MKFTIAVTSLLATAVTARQCKNLTIPIHASARNGVFNLDAPTSNIEVTNFILNLGQQGSNYTADILDSYTTYSGDYEIAATYCQPDSGPSSVIQILTHGIGFDRSYWDVPFNNYNYSYVAEAVDQYGYSTFTWDRLGIGMSSLGNPVQEIQALLEVDALKELTLAIKAGTVDGIPNCFEKYTHAGHSFGAQHTYTLTAMYPDISDGITLQGFSQNGTFLPFFLYGGDFIEANNIAGLSKYPDGYMAPGNPSGVQINFFSPGYFDPEILTFAVSTGQPVTVGELLTIGGETASINHFAGPTHIVTGGRDVPYCGGNCYAAPTGFENIPSQSIAFLPNAQNLKIDIIGEAGHGLNLEYDHPTTYATMLDYLVQNGLAPKDSACGGSSNGGSSNGGGNYNGHGGWGEHGGKNWHGDKNGHNGEGWHHGPPSGHQ